MRHRAEARTPSAGRAFRRCASSTFRRAPRSSSASRRSSHGWRRRIRVRAILRPMRYRGWSITGWNALALVAMSALVLAAAGTGEPGVRMLIRATARSSALLFLVAFLARPLRQLWRSDATAFALANRRYFGVSFAVSHLIHAIAIVWLIRAFPAAYQLNPLTLAFGGMGFVFVALLAATSSDAAVQKLGRARWTALHRTG